MEGYSLILADDHTLFRTGMASLLKNIPNVNTIYEAANGLEVITWLKSREGKIDLVLLDLKMPEMNGLETCRTIRRLYPDTKIVILTMIDQEQVIVQMIKEGINAYLLKNCSEEILYKTITEVLTKGFYFNDYMVKLIHNSMIIKKKNDLGQNYFSKRELEVIEALCDGLTTTEIANKLFISPRTVETHKQNLLEKTQTRSSVELALYSIRNGLVDIKVLLDN
jgi:DNA-binding NarL/FixJ family response regulator